MAEKKQPDIVRPGEIVKAQNSTLAQREELPEHLRGAQAGLGLEEMGRGDMTWPRIAIAQSLSPALKKSNPKHIEGLKEGDLYNTVTREIYGTSLVVVPIIFTKMRIYFEDITKGGGIICQSSNGVDGGHLCPQGCAQCEHSRWEDGESPDCNDFFNYACFLPENNGEIAVVSMKSTGIPVGKQWNALMRIARLPAFGKTYKLETVDEQKNNNDYKQWKVSAIGYTGKDIYEAAMQLHEQLKAVGVKVNLQDEDDLQDESFNTGEMESAAERM